MMTIDQAIDTWKAIQAHVNPVSLTDQEQHAVVHEIMHAVRLAIDTHQITYDEFERRAHV